MYATSFGSGISPRHRDAPTRRAVPAQILWMCEKKNYLLLPVAGPSGGTIPAMARKSKALPFLGADFVNIAQKHQKMKVYL